MKGRITFLGLVSASMVCACGGQVGAASQPSEPHEPQPVHPVAAVPTSAPAPTLAASAAPKPPSADEIFAKVQRDLAACYEQGRRDVPTMTAGKVTFQASVDKAGKTTCVVPSEDTGFTQAVEDCMRTRLGEQSYGSTSGPWTAEIPIVLRDSALSVGKHSEAPPAIETVESHGLSEEVYDIVESMLPDLYACVRGIDKSSGLRVVRVGGRVGRDGSVECALASSPGTVPARVNECAAGVLSRKRFPPPKKGVGLVSVPLNILGRG